MALCPVALAVNCGYARVCIYRNSNPGRSGPSARESIDTSQRATNFKMQFGSNCLPEDYFSVSGYKNMTKFERDCNKILDGFKSRFLQGGDKESYLETFSHSKWCELSVAERNLHSISKCVRCFELHKESQHSFPLKPTYIHKPMVTVDQDALQRLGVKKFTAGLLTELNQVYEAEASTSFTDALVQIKSSGLEKKKSQKEKRKEKAQMQKELTKSVNEHFAENAAISMLTQSESKRKYHKKRLAQSFHSPQELPPVKRKKSHSPNFSLVTWDKNKLRETIENWPTDTTINWSEVARDHGITGKNAGQVVKEFTEKEGIDTSHIATPKRKPTMRPKMRKLPGGEVSIPSNPSIGAIETEIRSMISSGRFTLGEECVPYTLTKYSMVSGVMTPHELQVQGRKVPLTEIRQRLLHRQLKYMRLTPESTIATMTRPELTKRLNMKFDGKSEEELRELLCQAQKSRSLCMWHDHATILKMGFVMVTVHIMYDPVVFYTEDEYQELHPGADVNIQAEVEQPEIHLLALGSSSVEDQAFLIGDRLSCILELSEPVKTESGIEITDTLRYFTGDHPATQFEQGSKQGGHYKCAVCGTKENLFNDQAHTLQHKWRNVQQLQTVAISGRYGRKAGELKPFKLRVKELRSELEARSFFVDDKMPRPELEDLLEQILRGVSRVPALLLTDPTQQLASLNLDKYEIVATEPLHDIKGHLINLITELPNVLPPGETKSKCTHLIDNCLAKQKKSGADMRRVAIQLFLLLKDNDCSSKILFLLHSIIKIGEIAYSRDDKRCPRQLLQCYNMCWMHMEVLKDLFGTPKEISRTKFFGHLVHALTAHIPTQLELACQRSLNTEGQERLFGQARLIGETCTNHHPDNVIPQIMLRLQAKQEQREIIASVKMGDSQVSHVAKDMPQLSGTKVKTTFIQQREDSWQVHLQRISPFLVAGEGVWWFYTSNGFVFHDGDTDPANPDDAFSLMHHRYHSVMDVEHRRDVCWKRIVDEKIVIPAHSIKLYDIDGNKTGRLLYSNHTVTLESTSTSTCIEKEAVHTPEPSVTPSLENPVHATNTYSMDSEASTSSTSEICPPNNIEHDDSEASTSSTSEICPPNNIEHDDSEASTANTSAADAPSIEGAVYLNLNVEEHHEGLKSIVANSIKHLIGSDNDLVEFDDLRFNLKKAKLAGKHINTASISKYRQMLKKIETKVKLVQSERAAKLKELEQKEFQKSGKLPAKTRGSYYYNILKERNLATKILRNL